MCRIRPSRKKIKFTDIRMPITTALPRCTCTAQKQLEHCKDAVSADNNGLWSLFDHVMELWDRGYLEFWTSILMTASGFRHIFYLVRNRALINWVPICWHYCVHYHTPTIFTRLTFRQQVDLHPASVYFIQ